MLNLDGARRRTAKLMTGTCRITRDVDRYADGFMNPITLAVTPAPPNQIYEDQCYVAATNLQSRQQDVGGAEASQKLYELGIPWDAVELRPGDLVEMLTSRDPLLVGKKFKIKDVGVQEILVWRLSTMIGQETSRGG